MRGSGFERTGARLYEGLLIKLEADDLAERFRAALADEEEHLTLVRRWVEAALTGQAR